MKSTDRCYCGSGLSLNACCARWYAGEPAPDAESLMRSRYTAFVLGNEPYLLSTWHPRTRPASVSFDGSQKWLGLKVVNAKVTGANTAEVEFVARYRIGGGSAARLHERSRFVREEGRWFYFDGDLCSGLQSGKD